MITLGAALKYSLAPDLLNRSRNLFASGFGYLGFFLAQVYRSTGVLPPHHPYIRPENAGRFGIRHVISEGFRWTDFNRKNIDRVCVLIFLMLGLFLLFSQIALLFLTFFMDTAFAAVTGGAFLTTERPEQDIAFVLLDHVFGIPDFFNSCVATRAADCLVSMSDTPFPTPFHNAIHQLFQFYSIGLLVIAAMILAYFVFAVIAETAESGTPFGKRFNHVWAPIRLVAAIGLLIPVSNGLNSAQYITLYAAKFGSSFATNGWLTFVDTAVGARTGTPYGDATTETEDTGSESPCARASGGDDGGGGEDAGGGSYQSFVACPNRPPLNTLMEFFTAVATCHHGMKKAYPERDEVKAYIVKGGNDLRPDENRRDFSYGLTLEEILEWNDNVDVEVVFGLPAAGESGGGPVAAAAGSEPDRDMETLDYRGGVVPMCGSIRMRIPNIDQEGSPGAFYALEGYLNVIQEAWHINTIDYDTCEEFAGIPFGNVAQCMIEKYMPDATSTASSDPITNWAELLTYERVEWYEKPLDDFLVQAIRLQAGSGAWREDLEKYGWGGAAIWYNKIAQLNGTLFGSVYAQPIPVQYPMLMEEVIERKTQNQQGVTGPDRYNPSLADGQAMDLGSESDYTFAVALYHSQKVWEEAYTEQQPTNNAFIDAIQLLFGVDGLFNMRANIERGVHPLAALSGIGKSLIESSIVSFAAAAGAGLAGGIANLLPEGKNMAAIASGLSSFMMTVAGLGLTIGFVLFYIIPFMPFIYFFFAVGGWIKGLFEAMVGVPLWALAHLRIDGNGLPGDAAMQGYYLILEIFLRPILIIFGLLAGIVIFSAQMTILNDIWDTVTSNLAGFNKDDSYTAPEGGVGAIEYARGYVDQFFYLIVYTVIGYMMAIASFKLIDQIPNHIMRWMGANVTTFGDQSEDAAQGLIRGAYFGSGIVSDGLNSAVGGLKQTGKGVGEIGQQVMGHRPEPGAQNTRS